MTSLTSYWHPGRACSVNGGERDYTPSHVQQSPGVGSKNLPRPLRKFWPTERLQDRPSWCTFQMMGCRSLMREGAYLPMVPRGRGTIRPPNVHRSPGVGSKNSALSSRAALRLSAHARMTVLVDSDKLGQASITTCNSLISPDAFHPFRIYLLAAGRVASRSKRVDPLG